MRFDEYVGRSRQLSVSLLFILPLLISYEVGILLTGGRFENLIASHLFKGPLLRFFGTDGFLVFNAILMIGFCAIYAFVERHGRPLPDLFLGMIVESACYAGLWSAAVFVLLGLVSDLQVAPVAESHTAVSLALSMGAGVYEEVFFRLLLISGIMWVMHDPEEPGSWGTAALFAVVVSSTLFAAAHYLGPHGEPFAVRGFAFRYLSGVALALIYLWRGLGIAVYTHAFYDILFDLKHLQ